MNKTNGLQTSVKSSIGKTTKIDYQGLRSKEPSPLSGLL